MQAIPITKQQSFGWFLSFLRIASVTLVFMPMCATWAQEAALKVIVKEKGSGAPLADATVVITGTEVYETTDAQGEARFAQIPEPGAQAGYTRVKVLAPGYETWERNLKQGERLARIYLVPLSMESEGLEVSAERIVDKVAKISLSRQELTGSAGTQGDPLKAIKALPGIVAAEESSGEVYMRGSDTHENIVWINRAPVGYLYHLGGFQSTINPALVQDINVFPAGFPVEYGDALGGVIDVQLRAPKNDRVHYQFDISTIMSSFLVEGPVGAAKQDSFFAAGRRSYIDLLFSPSDFNDAFNDEDEEDPDQITLVPRFYDAQALYHNQQRDGSVDYYLFAAGDEFAEELKGSAKSDPQLAGKSHQRQQYQTAGATWRQRWSSEWDQVMAFGFYHSENEFRIGQDDNGDPFFANSQADTLFWQPELSWSGGYGATVSYGFTAMYVNAPLDLYISRLPNEGDPDFDFTSKKKYRVKETVDGKELAPYIKYRKQWNENWVTTLGLRYGVYEISGGFSAREFSPRASLEYSVTPDTLVSASWGRYVQLPQFAELIDDFGNPGLQVTEAEHRVLGIEHRFSSIYSAKAEIYHKPMKNLVVSVDENDPPDNQVNEGTGEAYGLDLFIKREARDRKIGWLALSLSKSERTNERTGETHTFSGDQPFALKAVWGQPFGGSWKRWDWSVKGEARSGAPYTKVTGRHRDDPNDPDSRWIAEYGKHNGARTPFYSKVDVRIGREVLYNESKLKFYLDLQNVLLQKNVIEYDYGNEYERIDNPREIRGMGFFPFFGVEMQF